MSTLVDIADAVVASLNGGSFSQAFTAERLYRPTFSLDDLTGLKVSVVPKGVTIAAASRTSSSFDLAVDIGIQKKIGGESEIDALLDLAEQIGDHLRTNALAGVPEAVFVSIEHDPVIAAEHLDEQRTLTSVLTAIYRVRR